MPQTNPLPILRYSEVPTLLTHKTVVENLLASGGMSVLFGAAGTGKSFVALDVAAHVAAGLNWCGHKVARGTVVYVCAEGTIGIQNRIAAFREHHKITDIPLAIIPTSIDLRSNHVDTSRLVEAVHTVSGEFGVPAVLIILDTLSHALAGGDENASSDMGRFVVSVDRIREETGAHLLAVHHVGKDKRSGPRGHSLLHAAADSEIEVSRRPGASISLLRVTKQRDLPADPEIMAFRLEPVRLGTDENGDSVSSCVLIPVDTGTEATERVPILPSGAAKVAVDLLAKAIADKGEIPPTSVHAPVNVRAVKFEVWRTCCYSGTLSEAGTPHAKQKAFQRAHARLKGLRAIEEADGWVWLTA